MFSVILSRLKDHNHLTFAIFDESISPNFGRILTDGSTHILNDPYRFIADPDWAANPDWFIAEPDWFVDVSDRVIIVRTEPELHNDIPWFQFVFAFPTHQSLNF